jgi:hypothetical protein
MPVLTETRLWDVDHPYYCSESNFYSHDPFCRHDSWHDFAETMGKSDGELNLLFRWDWKAPRADDGDGPIAWIGDENHRDSYLQLFFVMQREGIFACHEVSVCRADEPKIAEWLKGRLPYLLKLWEPLVEVQS